MTAISRIFEMHGARFESFVAPSSGSTQLCAWRTTVAPGQFGLAHTVSDEEVFLVLTGAPTITVDGVPHELHPAGVVLVPAGSSVQLDNPGIDDAALWVTTVVGLTATTPTGDLISPPWAN